jgi:ADP-ribose pyrophosphatase
MKKWNKDKEELVSLGRIFSYHSAKAKAPDGSVSGDFDVLHFADWVNIVALTKDDEIILIKQYRVGNDDVTIETPGGAFEMGEDPLDTAKREMLEETGYESKNWEKLTAINPNPAFMTNKLHIFLALDCELTSPQNLDELEDIEVFTCPISELHEMIKADKIDHSLVITALFFAAYKVDALKAFV